MNNYTKNADRIRILLWGGYPPPYGGITVHIKRLRHVLQSKGFSVTVVDHLSKNTKYGDKGVYRLRPRNFLSLVDFIVQTPANKYDLAHIHVSSFSKFWWAGYVTLLMAKRSVLTIHTGRAILPGRIKRIFIDAILKRINEVILVNTMQKTQLESAGIHLKRPRIIPAFLPPEHPEQQSHIPEKVQEFARDSKIVLISGSPLLRVYDFKTTINALAQVPATKVKVIFIFYRFDAPDNDINHEKEIRELISTRLKQNYLIYEDLKPELFTALLKVSDIYIRSTTCDGDAVSVREALHYGKKVVASDSAIRPDGCFLFKTLDSKDLAKKLLQALKRVRKTPPPPTINYAEEILKIYSSIYPKIPSTESILSNDVD